MLSNKVLDTLTIRNKEIFLKKYHIDRTFEALQLLFHNISRTEVQNTYDQLESKLSHFDSEEKIIRIVFSNESPIQYTYEIQEMTLFESPIELEIVQSVKNLEGRGLQNYKWTDRAHWADLLAAKVTKAVDVLAQNSLGQVTETSRCNLFIYDREKNFAFTPTLDSGCINGVYRRFVLDQQSIELPEFGLSEIIEKDILVSELVKNLDTYALFVANSVRGVMPALLRY